MSTSQNPSEPRELRWLESGGRRLPTQAPGLEVGGLGRRAGPLRGSRPSSLRLTPADYPQDTLPQSFNATAMGQEITVVQRLENGLPVATAATSSAETQAPARQWVRGPVAQFTVSGPAATKPQIGFALSVLPPNF